MYERILVGTDGSPRADDAVRRSIEIATASGLEELHVVSACDPISRRTAERIRRDLPPEFRDLIDPDGDADNQVAAAKAVIGAAGLRAVTHPAIGDPADAILRVAADIEADLVVVGARGLNAIERFLRGSVSTRVAHHCPCDVLIVEHDA